MGLGLGLRLGLGGAGVLGPALDPDAAEWFEAVEATGATFGPDSATVSTNKTAWSNWVIAQKNAESPIEGRSNWQQLTQAGEGFIQPMMGLSTFNVPPLFGGRTFTGFVAGDYIPALGLNGGDGRVLFANRNWNNTPLDDVAAGVWVTGPGGNSTSRILGIPSAPDAVVFLEDVRTRCRSGTLTPSTADSARGPDYSTGTFPRAAFINRSEAARYTIFTDASYTIDVVSVGTTLNSVSFFANDINTGNATIRGGLAFYGRSINLEAMNTACIALSEAIVWPT